MPSNPISHAKGSAGEVSDYDSEYERKDRRELFVQECLSTNYLADFSERSAILTDCLFMRMP
jgi:hypothetical protein